MHVDVETSCEAILGGLHDQCRLWLRPRGGVRRLACRDRHAISGMQMVCPVEAATARLVVELLVTNVES